MTKLVIDISEDDEYDHNRSMKFTQHILTTEDFEYACVKAGLAWGFDEPFFDHCVVKEMTEG